MSEIKPAEYYLVKSFDELDVDDQIVAMEKMYKLVLDELVAGRKTPITDPYAERYGLLRSAFGWGLQGQLEAKILRDPILEEWVAETAGILAAEAYYIPDDGAQVVRI